MDKTYIILCVLIWTICSSTIQAHHNKGNQYTADFLYVIGSKVQYSLCNEACKHQGLCKHTSFKADSNRINKNIKRKHRGTKGLLRRLSGKDLKCCLMNARSVVNKTMLIRDFVKEKNIDVAVITETWLNVKDGQYQMVLNEICPEGHRILSKPRDKRGGGLAIIYRSNLNPKVLDIGQSVNAQSYEHLTISLTNSANDKLQHTLVAVYRPPSKSVPKFMEELLTHLSEARLCLGTLTLCGDFNIHLEKTTLTTSNLRKILDSHGLHLNITQATHTKGHTLDAIITEHRMKVKVLDTAVADHYTLIYHLRCNLPILEKPPGITSKYYTTRNFSKIDTLLFSNNACEFFEGSVIQTNDANAICDILLKGFLVVLNEHAPLVRKRHRLRKFKFNSEIADAKKLRRKLERKFTKSKLTVDRELLIKQNKVVAELVKRAKGLFFSDLIERSNNKPKALFKVFADLTTDTSAPLPTSLKDPAESFASFFSDKVTAIVDSFPPIQRTEYIPSFDDLQFNIFDQITAVDLNKMSIKCSSADPAPTNFVRKVLPSLVPTMVEMINSSFTTGVFPNALKDATLIPIIKDKKADVNQLKNYRPISLLSYISKVLEGLAAKQLSNYIVGHNLGNLRQSAYKTGHSVETTLLALQSELLEVLDRGNVAFLVLMDLSAAFDTVNHDLLIDIMNNAYHITGKPLEWFRSYLSGRTFRVKVGDSLSSRRKLNTGVPQGSVLGPMLFNIFSSGLANIFSDFGVSAYFYADDTQFFVEFDPTSHEAELEARNLISRLFARLQSWMLSNHLKLNADKTVFLPISRKALSFDPLLIGTSYVQPAEYVRNLGFIFNRSLTIDNHLSYIKRTTFFHLRRICALRNCVSFGLMEILVHAFITSRLDFCNSLFYGSTQLNFKTLQSIFNAAAKALCGVNRKTDSAPVLHQLHWLPILSRVKFKLAVIGFNIVHSKAPEYFQSIKVSKPVRYTRSSKTPLLSSNLYLSKTRLLTYGDRSCFNSICAVFNSLPSDLRGISNFSTFKSKIKTHFFSSGQ